jgi:predicted RNase H-like nuclease (RuvC/YqgF family)
MLMDSSIELKIQNAARKAEEFTESLREARMQEAKALQTLENERNKWNQVFEEKSVAIEQLERELEATVDALQLERSLNIKEGSGPNGSPQQLDDGQSKTWLSKEISGLGSHLTIF